MTTATHLNLESVQLAFRQWRETKSHCRAPFPDHLRHQALALLSTHRPSVIQKALGISDSMFKNWQGMAPQLNKPLRERHPQPPSLPQDFVPLSLSFDSSAPLANATLPTITVELTLNQGGRLQLHGALTADQLECIVRACCSGGLS
jgi:hypothetical protein